MTKVKRAMVFGTFDGIHQGHLYFLEKAKSYTDELVVCLSRDVIVQELKKQDAQKNEKERNEDLEKLEDVDRVMMGDEKLGSYECIAKANPDLIIIGYDQEALYKSLSEWIVKNGFDIQIEVLDSFEPEKYKSSILRK